MEAFKDQFYTSVQGPNLSYCPAVPTTQPFNGRHQQVPQPLQGLRRSNFQRPHRIYNHSSGVVASPTGRSFPDHIPTGIQQFRGSSAVRLPCSEPEISIALGKPQQQIQLDDHCSIENPTEITVPLPKTNEEARPQKVKLSDSPLPSCTRERREAAYIVLDLEDEEGEDPRQDSKSQTPETEYSCRIHKLWKTKRDRYTFPERLNASDFANTTRNVNQQHFLGKGRASEKKWKRQSFW